MKKLLGLGLLLSLLLNAFLLLQRRREMPPPPVLTQVIERTVVPEPVPAVVPPPVPVVESRPSAPADPIQVTLVVSQAFAEPGADITVTCTVGSGAPQPDHWIGLFTPQAHVTNHSGYRMMEAAQACHVFKAPRTPGEYEFRYVLGDNRTVVATSNRVRVLGAAPVRPLVDLQAGTTVVRCGGEIQARWSVYSGRRSTQDWIGLFAPAANNDQFTAWKYVAEADQGMLTLEAPEEPGTYELRYLLDNGYEPVAVSVPITVVP